MICRTPDLTIALAKELEVEPPYAEYQSVESLPRIEVEFYHLKHSSESYGRLSILDTPGPNEFGQSDALKKVFQMQLRQASAVLLVMDYTQLNSESDGKLRQEVDSIKKDLGERLFVLVNKFDNANKNTMNKEQTRHYVATKLLSKFSEEKVFPVSSWFGYLANRALSELERSGKINPVDAWVEDFGVEEFGRKWQKYVDSPEDVKSESKTLWKDSNFQDPLDKVIKEAHAKAAFEALSSSLDKINGLVGELDKGARGRISGLETDVEALQTIIIGIKKDLGSLDGLVSLFERSVNAEIDNINNAMINLTLKSVKEAVQCVEEAFSAQKEAEETHELMLATSADNYKQTWPFFPFFCGGKAAKKYNIEDVKSSGLSEFSANNDGKILFAEKAAAKAFVNKITDLLDSVILEIDASIEPIIKKRLAKLQGGIDIAMEKNINSIIKKAQERLKDNGVEVAFRLPSFTMNSYSGVSHHSFLDHVEDKTEMRVGSRRKDGFWSGVKNFFNDDWGREEYDYKDTKFEISLESIKEQSKIMLESHAEKVKESQSDFLAKDLNEQVKSHIENIKNYLERYRGDLSQGLKDQRETREKKELQKKELNGLIPKLIQCLEDTSDQENNLKEIEERTIKLSPSELSNEKCVAV